MRFNALLLGVLAHQATAVVDEWTPEGFDWDSQISNFDCATQNVSSRPHAMTKELVVFAAEKHNMTETDLVVHQAFAIGISLGVALRAGAIFADLAGVASTALGCFEVIQGAAKGEQTTAKSKTSCIIGAIGSAIGFGAGQGLRYFGRKAAAAALLRARPPTIPIPELGQDFRQAMELTGFVNRRSDKHPWKRGLEERGVSEDDHWHQYFHNSYTADLIRDANLGDGEFLGYAHEGHQLSRRDGVHPLAPRFKFDHPTHGPMVLSTMFSNQTAHITVEPWVDGNPAIHKRWQEEYRKEVLENKKVIEGRFDHSAAAHETADIDINRANVFRLAEDNIHCMLGGQPLPMDQGLDVQMYDDTNRVTFGYGTIGVFNDESHESGLENLTPNSPVSSTKYTC